MPLKLLPVSGEFLPSGMMPIYLLKRIVRRRPRRLCAHPGRSGDSLFGSEADNAMQST
jgi:hypothetical protein